MLQQCPLYIEFARLSADRLSAMRIIGGDFQTPEGVNRCINLRYDETKLKYSYYKLIRRHTLCEKFPELKTIF